MKSFLLVTGLLLSVSVVAAPNYKGYAEDMSKKENVLKLNQMERACKPVNGVHTDPVKCKELASWQLKKQCEFGILDKDKCKGL